MRNEMRRPVLVAAVLGLLAVPSSASAFDLNYEAPSASVAKGAPLTFAVRTDAPEGTVVVRVSGADDVDDHGLLTGPDGSWLDEGAAQALPDLQVWTVPSSSLLRQRPGRYYWQAYLNTGAADAPIGPVRELVVTLPVSQRGHGKLYPSLGKRGSAAFAVSSAGIPVTIDGVNFKKLVTTTAARWGLKARGWTTRVAGVQDGHSVAGFSSDIPSGVLGVQTDFMRRGKVVERDLALRAEEQWSAGPDYPGLDQIDVESVLLHELGHMAGNKKHTARCANSPMDEALGAGEWWRGKRDKWFGNCSSGARASSLRTLVHRVVRVD
jgi:hypothetical protein